jgi:hypothetical protein
MAVNDLISKLQKINNENYINVYIPSLRKEAKFKPLTLKQQKDILKSGINNDVSSALQFNIVINQIIKENSVEPYTYKVIDRIPIIIALRNKFSSDPLDLNGKKIDIQSLSNKRMDMDCDEIFTCKENTLAISASIPCLDLDDKFNKKLLETIEKNNDAKLSNVIGDMYLYEITKFINTITVDDASINVSDLDFNDSLNLISSLPASTVSKLNNIISKNIRSAEEAYITVDDEKIPLDASLFV